MTEKNSKTREELTDAMSVKGEVMKDYEEESPKDSKVFILDVETGGLNPNKHALIDAHLRSLDGYKKTFRFPVIGIVEHQALLVNKKNFSDLLAVGHDEGDNSLVEIVDILKKNPVVIGHNINFDLEFLGRFINNISVYSIDTKDMAKIIYPGIKSYSLKNLALNILGEYDEERAHTSAYDCLLTEKLLWKILEDDKEDKLKLKWLVKEYRDSNE